MNNTNKNIIGQRGENLFATIISKFIINENAHLFSPEFLGDKYPSVDYIVDLLKYNKSKAFFFVSVRSTRIGYTKKEKKLKVKFPKNNLDNLKKIPIPTYLVGIDEENEKGYIISVQNLKVDKISSLSTKYPINQKNIVLLWNEVKNYWKKSNELAKFNSKFKI